MKSGQLPFRVKILLGLALAVFVPVLFFYQRSLSRRFLFVTPQLETRSQMMLFEMGLEQFKGDCHRFPSEAEGVRILHENFLRLRNWNGPYVEKYSPVDGWGNSYVYRLLDPAAGYEIISYGADGKPGGKGPGADIVFSPGFAKEF